MHQLLLDSLRRILSEASRKQTELKSTAKECIGANTRAHTHTHTRTHTQAHKHTLDHARLSLARSLRVLESLAHCYALAKLMLLFESIAVCQKFRFVWRLADTLTAGTLVKVTKDEPDETLCVVCGA